MSGIVNEKATGTASRPWGKELQRSMPEVIPNVCHVVDRQSMPHRASLSILSKLQPFYSRFYGVFHKFVLLLN